MKNAVMSAALAFSLLGAGASLAQTQAPTKEPNKVGPAYSINCQSMWNEAGPSSDGTIPTSALSKYSVQMSRVDANGDGRIVQSEFMAACQAGLLRG